MPMEGNLYRAEWLKVSDYDCVQDPYGEIVQSWDSAIKTGSNNDYSVCITARVVRNKTYILDVWRGKLEFPDLLRKVIELARLHKARTLLIEDKASGHQLIQALRFDEPRGVPGPIGLTPNQDKHTRAHGVSSMVEAGQLFLPDEAHWLAQFRKELLAFPNSRHDDQVDAFSQLLNWVREHWSDEPVISVGATIVTYNQDGTFEAIGDNADLFYGTYNYGDDPWGID